MSEKKHCKVLIVGSGPAGYSAAVYAARANLNPVIVSGLEVGGQLMTTTDVDNWVGDNDGVQGPDLMERMRKHAERFNTEVINDYISSVDFSKRPFTLNGGSTTYTADAVIIALVHQQNTLALNQKRPSEEKGSLPAQLVMDSSTEVRKLQLLGAEIQLLRRLYFYLILQIMSPLFIVETSLVARKSYLNS